MSTINLCHHSSPLHVEKNIEKHFWTVSSFISKDNQMEKLWQHDWYSVDMSFPNVHFILNKSTKTNIRYLQYLHGNVHFLWSFFQLDGFRQGRQWTAAQRSEINTCWIHSIFNQTPSNLMMTQNLITFLKRLQAIYRWFKSNLRVMSKLLNLPTRSFPLAQYK